jgi:hypothetical protein
MKRFLLLVILVLTACIPQPTTPSGPSAAEVEAMIGTSVALTVTAHAQTQAAIPTVTPTASRTDTPSPTVTASPFPTLTPFSTPTKFPTSAPADYACVVFNKYPADNSIFKPNKDFDVKFWLRNVGSRKWDKGADLSYHDGTKMIVGATVYELPEVKPGQQVGPFIFDARSPKKIGDFVMRFKVQGGFCYPYIKILVRK